METFCTFHFVLLTLVIIHQTMRQSSLSNKRDATLSGIAIAASYIGFLALDATVSTGVMNPALSVALALY
jgi:glycerol uptake facilitator-like aquaporin